MLGSTYLRVKREAILREPQDERSDDRYTCAVQLEERDPLGWVMKALREAGNSVANELAGIDEEALVRRPADDELCLKEIAAHLRDSEELAVLQITSLIEEPNARVPVWDVDVLPMERDYRSERMDRFLNELACAAKRPTCSGAFVSTSGADRANTPTKGPSRWKRSLTRWRSMTWSTCGRCAG